MLAVQNVRRAFVLVRAGVVLVLCCVVSVLLIGNANLAQDGGGGDPEIVGTQNLTGDDGFEQVVADPDASDDSSGGGPAHAGKVKITLPGAPGNAPLVTLVGKVGGDRFGYSVSATMDYNLDGHADVVVGAPHEGSGRAYVFFGPFPTDNSSESAAEAGLELISAFGDGYDFGDRVAPITDFNDDGFPDIRVREHYLNSDGVEESRTWIFDSATGGPIRYFPGELSEIMWDEALGDLDGDGDVDEIDLLLMGERIGLEGASLTMQDGDLNGDGVIDSSDMGAQLTTLGADLFGPMAQGEGGGGEECPCQIEPGEDICCLLVPPFCCSGGGGGGPVCGNGICEQGEDPFTCPVDCSGLPECGNGVCEQGEDENNCPGDCASVPDCGNGVCDQGENASNCPGDCDAVCGNGICEPGEDELSCPEDCGLGLENCFKMVWPGGVPEYACVGSVICIIVDPNGLPDAANCTASWTLPQGVCIVPEPTSTCEDCLDPTPDASANETVCMAFCEPGTHVITLTTNCHCDGAGDTVVIKVVEVDLDVDSDNDNSPTGGPGGPPPDPETSEEDYEDSIEDISGDLLFPGKLVSVNIDDDDYVDLDNDGVDDWGDLISDWNDGHTEGFSTDNPEEDDFVPARLRIAGVDPDVARIQVSYQGSQPGWDVDASGNLIPYPGYLRLWTQPGSASRNGEYVEFGGDYLAPGEYDLADLGVTTGTATLTWYVESVRGLTEVADNNARILVRLDPDGDGPAEYLCADAVRLTPVALPFIEQTTGTPGISSSTPIPNPSLLLRDNQGFFAPSRFGIDADGMRPTHYWANRETVLTWHDQFGSPVTFVENAGDEFHVRGTGEGEAVFYPRINGIRLNAPVIRAPVVPSRVVYVRVNIVYVPGEDDPVVNTVQEVEQMVERMGVYWRQAGIRFVLEQLDPGYEPPEVEGAEITQLVAGQGVFRIDITDTDLFDGTIRLPENDPDELAELGRVNGLHAPPSGIIPLCSVPAYANGQGAGTAGEGTHTYNGEHHLLFSAAALESQQEIWGGPGVMLDPVNMNRAGLVAAHECGHVFRLAHPDATGSPLLIEVEELRNLMHSNSDLPDSEDLLRRQGELARFSTFLQEDF